MFRVEPRYDRLLTLYGSPVEADLCAEGPSVHRSVSDPRHPCWVRGLNTVVKIMSLTPLSGLGDWPIDLWIVHCNMAKFESRNFDRNHLKSIVGHEFSPTSAVHQRVLH